MEVQLFETIKFSSFNLMVTLFKKVLKHKSWLRLYYSFTFKCDSGYSQSLKEEKGRIGCVDNKLKTSEKYTGQILKGNVFEREWRVTALAEGQGWKKKSIYSALDRV